MAIEDCAALAGAVSYASSHTSLKSTHLIWERERLKHNFQMSWRGFRSPKSIKASQLGNYISGMLARMVSNVVMNSMKL
jgi:hypothetical protein